MLKKWLKRGNETGGDESRLLGNKSTASIFSCLGFTTQGDKAPVNNHQGVNNDHRS